MVPQRAGWPVAIAWFLAATVVSAQPPWAGGPPGRRGPDPAAAEDRALFHDLIENRAAIRTKLIRAHADVVSRFLSEGWSEMRRDHPVPPR